MLKDAPYYTLTEDNFLREGFVKLNTSVSFNFCVLNHYWQPQYSILIQRCKKSEIYYSSNMDQFAYENLNEARRNENKFDYEMNYYTKYKYYCVHGNRVNSFFYHFNMYTHLHDKTFLTDWPNLPDLLTIYRNSHVEGWMFSDEYVDAQTRRIIDSFDCKYRDFFLQRYILKQIGGEYKSYDNEKK